jgi:hypothetical protein
MARRTKVEKYSAGAIAPEILKKPAGARFPDTPLKMLQCFCIP